MTGRVERVSSKLPDTKIVEVDREMAAARAENDGVMLLHQALEASHLSQREVAKALGVSDGRVSQVLNQEHAIRVSTLARYLATMGFILRLEADCTEPSKPSIGRRFRRRRSRRGQAPVEVHRRTYNTGGSLRFEVLLKEQDAPACPPDVEFVKLGTMDRSRSSLYMNEDSVRLSNVRSEVIEQ